MHAGFARGLACVRRSRAAAGPSGPIQMLNRDGRLLCSLLIENTKLAWAWAPNGNSPLRKCDPTRKDIDLANYDLRIN